MESKGPAGGIIMARIMERRAREASIQTLIGQTSIDQTLIGLEARRITLHQSESLQQSRSYSTSCLNFKLVRHFQILIRFSPVADAIIVTVADAIIVTVTVTVTVTVQAIQVWMYVCLLVCHSF